VTGLPVVLVNGLPGAGKTSLARTLSQRLRLPLFSEDTIKEAHADVLGTEPPPGWPQRGWNAALGAAASETMWVLLADARHWRSPADASKPATHAIPSTANC
jgi:predicted kinase